MILDAFTGIAIAAGIMAVVSQIMQRMFMDKKGMKKNQEEMKEKQKKIKELMQQNDEKSKKEMDEIQQKMLESMNSMLQGSMKLMFFSMLVFIPMFWFVSSMYGESTINLPIPIPWFGGEHFIMLYNQTSWLGWYVLCSLVISLALNFAIGQVEKIKGGKK